MSEGVHGVLEDGEGGSLHGVEILGDEVDEGGVTDEFIGGGEDSEFFHREGGLDH